MPAASKKVKESTSASEKSSDSKYIFIEDVHQKYHNGELQQDLDWYQNVLVPGNIKWVNTIDAPMFSTYLMHIHALMAALKAESPGSYKGITFPSNSPTIYDSSTSWERPNLQFEYVHVVSRNKTFPKNNQGITTTGTVSVLNNEPKTAPTPSNLLRWLQTRARAAGTTYERGEHFVRLLEDTAELDIFIGMYAQYYGFNYGQIEHTATVKGWDNIFFVPTIPITMPESLARKSTYIDFDAFVGKSSLVKSLRKLIAQEHADILQGLHFSPTFMEMSVLNTKGVNRHAAKELLEKSLVSSTTGIKSIEQPPSPDEIGGFAYVKKWATLYKKRKEHPNFSAKKRARGVLIIGPPGTGKTLTSKALSSILEIPAVELDISQMMTASLGGTEKNLLSALNTIKTIGDCIVLIDEVEKTLGGATSSNRTDGGAMMRVVSSLLRFMEDDDHTAIVVMTANDHDAVPAPLMRSGRVDKILYAGVPQDAQRKEIVQILDRRYEFSLTANEIDNIVKNTKNYSGAELTSAFNELAEYRDIGELEHREEKLSDLLGRICNKIKPIAISKKDELQPMQDWASSNAIDVHEDKLY